MVKQKTTQEIEYEKDYNHLINCLIFIAIILGIFFYLGVIAYAHIQSQISNLQPVTGNADLKSVKIIQSQISNLQPVTGNADLKSVKIKENYCRCSSYYPNDYNGTKYYGMRNCINKMETTSEEYWKIMKDNFMNDEVNKKITIYPC